MLLPAGQAMLSRLAFDSLSAVILGLTALFGAMAPAPALLTVRLGGSGQPRRQLPAHGMCAPCCELVHEHWRVHGSRTVEAPPKRPAVACLGGGRQTYTMHGVMPHAASPCLASLWPCPPLPLRPRVPAPLAAGAYAPVLLSRRDRRAGGSGRSLTFVLLNMFSAGVMVSAGFCHLLGEALKVMPRGMQFPLAPFLCGAGYILTLVMDKIAHTASGGGRSSGGGPHAAASDSSDKHGAPGECCVAVLAGAQEGSRQGGCLLVLGRKPVGAALAPDFFLDGALPWQWLCWVWPAGCLPRPSPDAPPPSSMVGCPPPAAPHRRGPGREGGVHGGQRRCRAPAQRHQHHQQQQRACWAGPPITQGPGSSSSSGRDTPGQRPVEQPADRQRGARGRRAHQGWRGQQSGPAPKQ